MATLLWRIEARVVGAGAAGEIAMLLDEVAGNFSAFEIAEGEAATPADTDVGAAGSVAEWCVEAFARTPTLDAAMQARLNLAASAAGGRLVSLRQEPVPERDWLCENQIAFPPLRIGRFYVHGSHLPVGPLAGSDTIEVDAATAFGTGEHATTRGCLLAFERVAKAGSIRRPLDIGTGTGILAIAAAKRLRRRVLASDIEPGSVVVARHNTRRNQVAGRVRVLRAAGYAHRRIRAGRPYDLVFSNILARPLMRLAPALARHLAPGGVAILSGLLTRDSRAVTAAHRRYGLALVGRVAIDGWSTLILRRLSRPGSTGERSEA